MYATVNYRSNLQAPDLRPYFRHIHERVEPNSQGHTAISDFADKRDDDPVFGVHKRCWFWTLDEAAILYNCAKQLGGNALDIGGHTGWTSLTLYTAGLYVTAVDPMYTNEEFRGACVRNFTNCMGGLYIELEPYTSSEFFNNTNLKFDVCVIDGNHSVPCPLEDAQNSAKHLKDRGIILLHDYRGEPVKEGYRWLLDNGFQGKVYTTPNGVAVCWRGEFTPPKHVCDPNLEPCV